MWSQLMKFQIDINFARYVCIHSGLSNKGVVMDSLIAVLTCYVIKSLSQQVNTLESVFVWLMWFWPSLVVLSKCLLSRILCCFQWRDCWNCNKGELQGEEKPCVGSYIQKRYTLHGTLGNWHSTLDTRHSTLDRHPCLFSKRKSNVMRYYG